MQGIRATQRKSVIVAFKRHLFFKKNSVLQYSWFTGASPVAQGCKESTCNAGATEDLVWSLGWEDPLEEEMAIYSSILAWKIPWTEKPGRLQSRGSQRIGHDFATKQQMNSDCVSSVNCRHSIGKLLARWLAYAKKPETIPAARWSVSLEVFAPKSHSPSH